MTSIKNTPTGATTSPRPRQQKPAGAPGAQPKKRHLKLSTRPSRRTVVENPPLMVVEVAVATPVIAPVPEPVPAPLPRSVWGLPIPRVPRMSVAFSTTRQKAAAAPEIPEVGVNPAAKGDAREVLASLVAQLEKEDSLLSLQTAAAAPAPVREMPPEPVRKGLRTPFPFAAFLRKIGHSFPVRREMLTAVGH